MELYPGAVIAGRYRIDRKIGSGGMGEVWAGENVAIGVRVALKTLLPAAAKNLQIVARFRREAQLLGRLRSERVARVLDFIDDREAGLCLVMDYVDGEVLGEVLLSRRLGIEEAVDVGLDIVSALCDLHRVRVVHRDLKPDNIILEPIVGGRRRAVIVDLGVGRVEASDPTGEDSVTSITHVDTAVGTLPYMAPEQLLSSSTATASADVYAVGAILFRAVSGEQVFVDADDGIAARLKLFGEAPPLTLARVDRVARGFASVVARALRRQPDQRFASAEEMRSELQALQDLARATALDLDANTEEALPISSFGILPSLSGPPTDVAPPLLPTPSAAPRTTPSPAQPEEAPKPSLDGPTGEPTRLMSRVSRPFGDLFQDDTTQSSAASPASQGLPRVDPPASSEAASDPRTMSSPRLTRPTVLSPELGPATAPVADTLVVPPTVDVAPTVDAPPPARTVPLRTAVLGLVAALAVGTAIGFEAHRLLSQGPAHAGDAQTGETKTRSR
jgi:serine/threonine-protein kinase